MAKAELKTLRLCIQLTPLPVGIAEGVVSVGIQSGKADIVRGEFAGDMITFRVQVSVQRGRDDNPDFRGAVVQGRPGERFVYITWGTITDHCAHVGFRRLKLFLTRVDRTTWTQPGITWELLSASHDLLLVVNGIGSDGGPHCGSTAAHWLAST